MSTHEEDLESTFSPYDMEMTVQTEEPAAAKHVSAAPAKKTNSNLIVAGVVGVLIVGFVAVSFLKHRGSRVQPQIQPMTQQPKPKSTLDEKPNGELKPSLNSAQINGDNAAANFLSGQKIGGMPEKQELPANASKSEQTSQPVAASQPQVQGQVAMGGTGVSKALNEEKTSNEAASFKAKANGNGAMEASAAPRNAQMTLENQPTKEKVGQTYQSAAGVPMQTQQVASNQGSAAPGDLLFQLQKMFAEQSKEISDSIGKVATRVDTVDQEMQKQQEINASIEKRLEVLERADHVKVKHEDVSFGTKLSEHAVKGESSHRVRHSHKAHRHVVHGAAVLVDKSHEKPLLNLPKMRIYSVYSGRAWFKNQDGTLSTYAVGDRLPTGEIVKRIDDSTEDVITDKRVIR